MALLFMARSNSYKTRRQLVHCRIQVVTTRRNVVVNPSYLVQNSQKLVHCRIDVVSTRRNVVVSLSYLGIIPYYVAASRTGPVITSHYVATVAKNTREPTPQGEMCTRTVRQSTVELRDQYEKNSAHFGRRAVARFLNRLIIS